MFWCLKTNLAHHVWSEECEMASMDGYLVQYAPGCDMVWCEKSYFEKYYKKLI